jgi:hypothetical protein
MRMEPRQDNNAVADAHRPTNSQKRPKPEPALAQMFTKRMQLLETPALGHLEAEEMMPIPGSDSWDHPKTVTCE